MYRCTICDRTSKAGATRRVHVVRKPDGNVHRELPVCPACGDALDAGVTIRDLLKERERYTEVKPLPKPVLPPRPVLVGAPAKLFGQPINVPKG